jgi:curved DNA-binding protein CbpA
MSTGFYELLQVSPDASADAVRAAWQEQVAQVVRRLRTAESRRQDTAPLEARHAALQEAWNVLSDSGRRLRYDRFRELARTGLPADPDDLWDKAAGSWVDPAAAAALELVGALTTLRVGEPVAPLPEPERREDAVVSPAPAAPTGPTAPPPAPRPRADAGALPLDRAVPGEELARLFDQYGPSGAYLRAAREARRVRLEDLAATTKVAQRYQDALERDAFTELPAAPFVRGYVRLVARALEVLGGGDLEEFVEGYMARFGRARG